ncbi:hypothetical protein E2C01_013094 [Portunus trituberculatus]|uniref:Uncharacterized protein n=1 Tax=Portunus trituberculatus TaxID=210409 RepID=A0A5B7DFB5_PORTR|nr:hypothetical protein [Portunus trituberculatus]
MIYKETPRTGRTTSSFGVFLLNNNNINNSTWKRLRETLPTQVNKAQVIVSPAGPQRHLTLNTIFKPKLKTNLGTLGLNSALEDCDLTCPAQQ